MTGRTSPVFCLAPKHRLRRSREETEQVDNGKGLNARTKTWRWTSCQEEHLQCSVWFPGIDLEEAVKAGTMQESQGKAKISEKNKNMELPSTWHEN